MFKRSLPSPAMIVAFIALFAALGGTGYAATHLGSHARHAVSSKIRRGPRGRTGPEGPRGPQGPQGPRGPQGGDAVATNALHEAEDALGTTKSKLGQVKTETGPVVSTGQLRKSTAPCPAETFITGGGFTIGANDRNNSTILKSEPEGNSWVVEATPDDTNNQNGWNIKAWAECASP
jgi:hypothetical protein